MRVNSYAMHAYSQGRVAPFHCCIIDLSSRRPPKATKFGSVRNTYAKEVLFEEEFSKYSPLIHVLRSIKERLNVRVGMATISCKGACTEDLLKFVDHIKSAFDCGALTLEQLKRSPSEITDVVERLNFSSVALNYEPVYSCIQSANNPIGDCLKAWSVCQAAELELRLNKTAEVNPLELAQVAAASSKDGRPPSRLTITATYGMQLIGEDECTADLIRRFKASLVFNRLEEQDDQTATFLLRYGTQQPGLFLDLKLALSRHGNRRFQYSSMTTAVLEWMVLDALAEEVYMAPRFNILSMPCDIVIDVLRHFSRPDIDKLLLADREWQKAISKLSDALTLHWIDRCTVVSKRLDAASRSYARKWLGLTLIRAWGIALRIMARS